MNGSLIRRSGLLVAALSLTLLFGAGVFLNSGSSAKASDSETAALISDFNQYRASHGVAALSTSGSAEADAQAGAEDSVRQCGYTYQINGHSAIWGTYGYDTAAQVWAAYQGDSILDTIGDPYYGSVGIGRARDQSCSFVNLWVIILDAGGGPVTTPPPTSPPTPTNAPTPTSSPTPTPTPTPTHTPTPTPTPTPILDPSPPPTPPVMPGDVDCDDTVNMRDVILLLQAAANVTVLVPCLQLAGVDCTGGVDAADALVLLEFLENIPYHLPDGCPPLGSPTPSPTPGVAPIPAGINHCELAMVAYQMDTAESLNGEESCAPSAGTAYDCVFSTADHNAVCLASSSDFPNYTCSLAASFADCVPDTGAPEYQCFDDGAHMVECLPTLTGYAWYDCAVNGDDVTCTSVATVPNFVCRHEGAQFNCLALAPATPTAAPG